MKNLIVLITLIPLFFTACGKEKPILLGFSGCLTGIYSNLGTGARDGALLAVNEINNNGGINGRRVRLLAEDNKLDPYTALEVDRKLMKKQVAAIIGHVTSSMSLTAVPQINQKKVVMISPTTSTSNLSGIDDYFFRVSASVVPETERLVDYMIMKKDIYTVGIVYDITNLGFTTEWLNSFRGEFEQRGGKITILKPFIDPDPDPGPPSDLIKEFTEEEIEGLIFVTNPVDTALLCQYFAKSGIEKEKRPLLFSSRWAMTNDFIENGGNAAEGVVFAHYFNPTSTKNDYTRFKADYREAYGNAPNYASAGGYEAVSVFAEAMEHAEDPDKLKDTILSTGRFDGLQSDIVFDEYGDVHKKLHILRVKNSEFVTIGSEG